MKQAELVERYDVPYDISKVKLGNIQRQTKDLAVKTGYYNSPLTITTLYELQYEVTRGYPRAISVGDALNVMLCLLREGRAEVVTDEHGRFQNWLVKPMEKPTSRSAAK